MVWCWLSVCWCHCVEYRYTECRYTECYYTECCGAALFRQIIIFPQKWDKESHYQTYLKCSRKNLKIFLAKSSYLGNKLVCLSLAMLWAINKKIDCLRLSSVKHSSFYSEVKTTDKVENVFVSSLSLVRWVVAVENLVLDLLKNGLAILFYVLKMSSL